MMELTPAVSVDATSPITRAEKVSVAPSEVAAAPDPLQPAYVFAPPANPITPQLLSEFFRPGASRTNSVGVAVWMPVEVNFTPPIPKPEVSSRATYKLQ